MLGCTITCKAGRIGQKCWRPKVRPEGLRRWFLNAKNVKEEEKTMVFTRLVEKWKSIQICCKTHISIKTGGCSENRLWTQSHEHESFKRKTLKYLQIWISIYSFTEYRNNGYLIIRDIILDMLLINLLWLVTMIKSVINNNIILFLKKEKLIFHWLCIDLST